LGETANVCYVGGMGRLGYPMAVWTASRFQTVIADINEDAVGSFNAGTYHYPEPYVDEIAADGLGNGRLIATTDVEAAARNGDIIFVITQTPSVSGGSFTAHYVVQACKAIGRGLLENSRGFPVVSIASTVMPGTMEGVIRQTLERTSGLKAHENFGLCCTPEFVRQGSILQDFSRPDFVIVGCETDREWDVLRAYYHRTVTTQAPILRMSIASAEIAKLGLNVSVVAKVARANELALLCHFTPGADAEDVLHVIGLDSRIGAKYFSAGPPPGGPCFPRDNKAMVAALRERGIAAHVTEGVNNHERYLIKRMAWIVTSELDRVTGNTVGILGLTYKPGVPMLVGSPGLMLAHEVVLFPPIPTVYAYDPLVSTEGAENVTGCEEMDELVEASDVLVLMTPHEEFLSLSEHNLIDKVVVDMWGVLQHLDCKRYVRFGRG